MSDNEYLRIYMNKRYSEKREWAINLLGGKCCKCGSTENLEFDHINPEDKKDVIANLLVKSKERLLDELKKCQLLCTNCHYEKTLKDLNHEDAKLIHGTISSIRYCKCEICKKAKREYNKEYGLRKKTGFFVDKRFKTLL